MRIILSSFIVIFFLATGCVYSQDCVDGINKLPMYGGIKKCKEQLEDDKRFLDACDKSTSRKEAAAHMVARGWQYFYAQKLDTSMMRFNQAWLLDSLNSEIYWGFGNLLGTQRKFKESIPFFQRSLKLNPDNAKVWQDVSTSYGNLFVQTQDKKYLNAAIDAIKKAIHLDPKNAQLYGQLTASYSYFMQKDSARKYLKITETLDPTAINPEVKKLLTNN
ncbi:tetratricopeptide repeat protein [Mucilaginibacter sp.]|uniref:tetratricopeptide repeat protein n=1 Tax=Mucilaginibacter sp. TaxID=1882438 RepID=UPI003D0F5BD5